MRKADDLPVLLPPLCATRERVDELMIAQHLAELMANYLGAPSRRSIEQIELGKYRVGWVWPAEEQ